MNLDGQTADVSFPVSPLTITEVNAKTDLNSVDLGIRGANFVGSVTAQWIPEGGGTPVTGTVNRISDTAITVVLPGGTTGAGKLVLISTVGLRRAYSLTIK